jgi:TATA-binding protein-associated factor Taf7
LERKVWYRIHNEMSDEYKSHSIEGHDLPTDTEETTVVLITERDKVVSLWNEHKGGYTLITLPHIVTPYRDIVDKTRDRVTYQKLVTQ